MRFKFTILRPEYGGFVLRGNSNDSAAFDDEVEGGAVNVRNGNTGNAGDTDTWRLWIRGFF